MSETIATLVFLPEFSVNVTDLFASAQTDVQG